ncbi:MAG: F-type H+-transporting ATPase subunit gamma [Chloroflexi bacterium]|jgi:F-type H+-transporting ATPase subunit gamma|nr:MAG: F-type H+-transporting ATPase subunit gamma [Chloroflexota bacterium]|tara:strand:- start:1446 stop:2342 length:897 start_codon:yes stop_codon:yes gene_type:complete
MASGGSVREIKNRMSAVANTSKVTKAMELVSASKMRKAQQKALVARPYSEMMQFILLKMIKGIDVSNLEDNLMLSSNNSKQIGIIHVTPDRGLVGGLNTNMNKKSSSFILKKQAEEFDVLITTLGTKGRDFFSRAGYPLSTQFNMNTDAPEFILAKKIAQSATNDFLSGKVGELYIGYQKFITNAKQEPTIKKLLPINQDLIDASSEFDDKRDYLIEPDASTIIDALLPKVVLTQILEAILESAASEHTARMVAMHQATEAAEEMVSELNLTYNKARQEMITGELLDIVGGTAAISNS